MKKYKILRLEDNSEHYIIDTFKYGNKKYFLTSSSSDKEELTVCTYNNIKKCFEKIEDEEQLEFLFLTFKKKLKKLKNIEMLLNKIEFNEMEKLEIIEINNYDYKLKSVKDKIVTINIEFYLKQPMVNDYIYISEKVLNEKMLQYGIINDVKNIKESEIIKVVSSNEEYYLQRYYG